MRCLKLRLELIFEESSVCTQILHLTREVLFCIARAFPVVLMYIRVVLSFTQLLEIGSSKLLL